MKKSEKLMLVISKVLENPKCRIKLSEVEDLCDSRTTKYRLIKELTDACVDGNEAIFRVHVDGETEYLILNRSMFKYFQPSHLDTSFIFEAYKKIGSLLASDNFNEDVEYLKENVFKLNGHAEEMNRKFYYLDKVTRSDESTDVEIKSQIISALIGNKKITIDYNDKIYSEVIPLCLVQYRDFLYLVISKNDSLSSDVIRKFKVCRMKDVEVLDYFFSYPKGVQWSPQEYFSESSGIVTGDVSHARIRVFGLSRKQISEKSFFNKALIHSTDEYDDYEITYTSSDELLGQLFVYAQDIQILNNEPLKKLFIKKATVAIELNRREVA